MTQLPANKFFFWANGRPFQSLNKAKRYAQDTEANEILLMRGTSEQLLYLYHPMTERLERVCKVNDAKKRMNELLKTL